MRTIRILSPGRGDLGARMIEYRRAVSPNRLAELANELCLSVLSLNRLGIGWAFDEGKTGPFDAGDVMRGCGAWAFPMTDVTNKVLGIRLRYPDGRKSSAQGGREGLFIPCDPSHHATLFITEGATDCAALLSLDLAAVGRPNCTGGGKLLADLLRARRWVEDAIILADGDQQGERGAAVLARELLLYVKSVRIIKPPAGIKDARAWKISGATAADLRAVAEAAAVHKLAAQGRIDGGSGVAS